MKGYTDSRAYCVADIETEQVFDNFSATESDRPHKDSPDERARKIARLKAKVNAGEYEPDVMDIAKLLTSAMDPTL
ncbi:flagellar biosynthesis anti-sigma factor FlgM [uncultured Pseudodesulfovibrio sp.]|uniref:flagellar biosynthesis anti-sigma factor FlgM n=1 Tax=uncultured Pseudodesulfovibrio sp. TaxID=2035858 RepID=UPI0029C9A47F|nr:flagellar biosynthesis anti-sigma factor FlgM [uncultured Pseudodesulfovibrio sp.]